MGISPACLSEIFPFGYNLSPTPSATHTPFRVYNLSKLLKEFIRIYPMGTVLLIY